MYLYFSLCKSFYWPIYN